MKRNFIYIFFLFLIFSKVFTYENEDNKNLEDKKNTVLIDHLKAIVINDKYEKKNNVSNIVYSNVLVPKQDELTNQLSKYLNQKVTINLLKEIKSVITEHYRNNNYPLVGVKMPAGQNITNGEVYFVISLAKLGNVNIENNKYFSTSYMLDQISLNKGEVIDTNLILKDLEWFNDNPFRNVNVVYSPSDKLSETDITFHVEDITPYRVYAGYENTGNAVAGESRFFAGLNLGNVFKLDQQLNFQFTTAKDPQKWLGVSGTYIIPFPWHHLIKVLGSYSRVQPGVEEFQNLKGTGYYIGARYEIQLKPYKKYSHDFIFGYDFKTTNNFLTYADNLIFNNDIDVSEFLLKYQGILDDSLGSTSFELYLYLSPGNMTSDNNKKSYALERAGAKPNYAYLVLDIERITRLFFKMSLVTNFLGQVSSGKLLLSEQLSLGGYITIRGYMENEIAGDKGILFKNELRLPPIKFGRNRLENEIQFLGFLDYGVAEDVDKSLLDKKSQSLLSTGPGLRYRIGSNLTFRLDYGFQLKTVHGRFFGKNRDGRWHINVTGAY
ncbi:MAG: Heme/hemopexin transporter protein HuxB [Candidatus Anoxychlamydiales bacterium]|nr:Heme/hemopexin transporter protein HuxB [Candidatus Anoxychlamydiales bacterium]